MNGCRTLAWTIVAAAALATAVPGLAQTAATAGRVPPVDAAQGGPAAVSRPGSAAEDVNRRNADGSTPLQWAVYRGDAAEVRRLLRAGADVSIANHYGVTPMGLAAEVGDAEMIAMLLEAGADADADSPNPEGQTALLAVARTGNVRAAQLLIDAGATIDARERWGEQTALMWASARRHPAMIRLLIDHGADVNARSAVRNYQRHVTAEGRPKTLDSGGLTPLLYAARENCRACVEALLERGADVNLPDPDGVSPLLLAIVNANWDLARQLLEAGADVGQWNIFGETPLFTAVNSYTRRDGGRASIDPPNATSGREIVEMLLAGGADPNTPLFYKPARANGAMFTRGVTPLMRAAVAGDRDMIALLLEHGADATMMTADRQTLIHAVLAGRAQEAQAIELIRLFHEAGADVDTVALVNHPEEIRGGTALHYAVRKRARNVIRTLAELGIDMDAVDQDGLTALDYTQSRGFMPFMALQTPLYEQEAQLLRELGSTRLMAQSPVWPILGPPQGIWEDIYPLGESRVHEPIFKHSTPVTGP